MPSGNKAKTRLARKELLIAGVVLILSLGGLLYANREEQPTVVVDGREFVVQVADSSDERRLGLSGQDALNNDEAMLFIFDEPGMHGFWMKDMRFSIDIIWIDENLRVVHLEENVSPSSYPESFIPSVDAKYVLEIYTGQAAAQGIGLGDAVQLSI